MQVKYTYQKGKDFFRLNQSRQLTLDKGKSFRDITITVNYKTMTWYHLNTV